MSQQLFARLVSILTQPPAATLARVRREPPRYRAEALPVLAAIEANGRVAAVFSEPESHRTVQLKGVDARVEAVTAGDEASLQSYAAAMAARLAPFRVPEVFARALLSASPDDLVAVSFTPSQGFGQTPGPRAGMPLADGKP